MRYVFSTKEKGFLPPNFSCTQPQMVVDIQILDCPYDFVCNVEGRYHRKSVIWKRDAIRFMVNFNHDRRVDLDDKLYMNILMSSLFEDKTKIVIKWSHVLAISSFRFCPGPVPVL